MSRGSIRQVDCSHAPLGASERAQDLLTLIDKHPLGRWRKGLIRARVPGFLFVALIGATGLLHAQEPVATLIYPPDGAIIEGSTTFLEWTPVEGVEAYYLYIGSVPGARDLVDTGEIQSTSYVASGLPGGRTIYARIHTRFEGLWRYSETTLITTAAAAFVYPTDGAISVPPDSEFQWTAVAGAEAYYLYVGSVPGARDVVDTSEIQQTSYAVRSLPVGHTLYARIHTKFDGAWRSADAAFRVAPIARFLYPTDGAVIPSGAEFQWTTIAGAEAYYLYVGSSPGATDLVDTGEIQQTTYAAPPLVTGRTLYARIHTKFDGAWRSADAAFSVAPIARFLYPTDGATLVDATSPFRWTSVLNAQAYYLYVGSTRGAKDLVDTGEIPQTSFTVPPLPPGRVLYARIYTKFDEAWRFADTSFTVPVMARFLEPTDGSIWGDATQSFRWTTVLNAQAYYLYVGTTRGARDVVDTGEIQQTSHPVPALSPGRTLYGRIYTKFEGVWRFADASFTVPSERARFLHPIDGAVNVDISQSFRWTAPSSAEAYLLYIGTSLGASDLLNTGEIPYTSYTAPVLPAARTLYARIWTKCEDDRWTHADVSFTAAPVVASFVYPTHATVNVDLARPFQWTAIPNAQAYLLYVGSVPGGRDLVNTGEIQQTSYSISTLSGGQVLYARIQTKFGGVWRYQDVAFALERILPQLIYPTDGQTTVDTTEPFRWSRVDVAKAYRLEVGISSGLNDLHDSGEIRVAARFVGELPIGVPLFGRLSAKIGEEWSATAFTFMVGQNGSSMAAKIDSALWATDLVRNMAGQQHDPYPWTLLADVVQEGLWTFAFCTDYAATLISVLEQMNIGTPARRLDTCFNSNYWDCHTLVELWHSEQQSWMVLDPTFKLAAKRSSDGSWATATDIQNATLAQTWGEISYVFVGSSGDALVRAYPLDYPLFFLNLYQGGAPFVPGEGRSPLPYLEEVALPIVNQPGVYVLRSPQPGYADVTLDGQGTVLPCKGIDGLSYIFYASSVAPPQGNPDSLRAYRVRRFVF